MHSTSANKRAIRLPVRLRHIPCEPRPRRHLRGSPFVWSVPPNAELTTANATFKFKNTGKEAIRIGEVKPSCKCVTTVLEKMECGPDESGQLVMTIVRRGRTGNQTESARIKTSDGKETMLVMRMETARFLKVKPGFAIWKRDIENQTRDFEVEVTGDVAKMNELTVTSSNPAFEVKVIPVEAGKRYRVQVTAKDASAPVTATFTIQADYPKEQPGRIFACGKVL